jgi:hypothetical protein
VAVFPQDIRQPDANAQCFDSAHTVLALGQNEAFPRVSRPDLFLDIQEPFLQGCGEEGKESASSALETRPSAHSKQMKTSLKSYLGHSNRQM